MRFIDSLSGCIFEPSHPSCLPARYRCITGGASFSDISIPGVVRSVRSTALGTASEDSASSHTSSTPFSLLDAFVGLHIHRGGQRGVISGWSITAVPDRNDGTNRSSRTHRIQYQVSGNKYCARIGRAHKSNHIMFEADCSRGVLYQRCWDVECKGFRSDEIRIPDEAVPSPEQLDEAMLDLKISNHLKRHPELLGL